MGRYVLRRLLLILPTLFGIMVINFILVQFAPGGPVEQAIVQAQGLDISTTASVSAPTSMGPSSQSSYTGSEGLDPAFVARMEKAFGFDKPPHERFFLMLWNYVRLEFGESYFQNRPVFDLVVERLPVSVSLGLWSLVLIYGVSIPLGVAKAVRDGTAFDVWSSAVVFVAYAIPGFLIAVVLIILFAGGTYLDWFPMRGIVSEHFADLTLAGKVRDYFWHLALPLTALTLGGFATLTMLTKNSFLEEISKQFVLTARSKGLTEKARPVRPRIPQRHPHRHRRLPGRVRRPAVHRRAPDRGHLLHRRHRPARLRSRRQARLPDLLRHAVRVHADRPRHAAHRRHRLHVRRSAHRLRDARVADVPNQRTATRSLQVEPARVLLVLDLPGAVRGLDVCRVHRQRQTDRVLAPGRAALPHVRHVHRDPTRRRAGDRGGLPRSLRGWI